MNLEEARSLPELAGLDDEQIVDALHQAYYPDLPRDQVAASLGVTPKPPPAPQATWGDRAKDTGISLLKGAIGVPEAAVGLADLATGGKAGQLAEEAGFRPKEAKEALSEHYSPAQKAAFEQVQRAEGLWDTFKAAVSNPSTVIQSTVESLPAMGAGGVVARGGMAMLPKMGPVMAGAAGEGITQAGSAAEQTRQEAGTLDAKGAGAAIASGAIDTAIARFSGGLAKKLGIADVDTMLAGAAVNPKAAKGVVRAALQGMVTEGLLEELPQSVQEQVWANYAAGKPLDEGVNQAAVLGTLSGGLMGGGANVLNSMRTPAKPTVEDILAAPDVDTAIKTAQAAVAPPVAPEVVAPPVDSSVGKSLTGTDPATLLQRPDSFMDAVREPRSATGTAAGDLLASQPQDPLLGPAREDATAREDQRQDALATQAEQRMRREVDGEAQSLREWPPTSKREPAQPELDDAIQPGDLLDKAGAPFKELAAKLKAKNIGGEVIAVNGGFLVRPKKKENTDAAQPNRAGGERPAPAPVSDGRPTAGPIGADPGTGGAGSVAPTRADSAEPAMVPAVELRPAGDATARDGAATESAGPVVGEAGPSGVPAPANEPERRPDVSGLEADQPAGSPPPAAVASDTGARWTALPTAEREALLGRTAAKGKSRQRVAGQAWDDLAPGWKRAIERAMGAENVSRLPGEAGQNSPKPLSQNEKTAAAQPESRETISLEQGEKPSGKPRMGESADDIWQAIKRVSAGVVDTGGSGRILYPTLRVVGGEDFRYGPGGRLEVVDRKSGGVGTRDATEAEADEFHRDLSADRVQVLVMTAPGFGSGYKAQQVVRELHAPSGNDFKQRSAPAATPTADQPRDPESGQFVEAEVQAVLESRRKNNASGQGGEDVDKIRAAVTARQAATTNTVFTDDMAEKAREVLRRKLKDKLPGYSPGGKQAGSAPMLDPEVMLAGITLAGYHIERGARTFAAYARTMLADLGEEVRPSLKSWYMAVKYDPRAATFSGEMSSAAFVEEFDLSHLAAPSDTPALETQPPKADTGEANGTSAATRDLDSAGPGPLEGAPAGDVRAPAGERPAGGSAAGRGNVDQQRDAEPDASGRDLGPGVGADAGAVPVSAAGGRGRREGAGNARLPRAPRPDAGAGLFDDAGREDPGLSAPNAPPIAAPQFKPEDVADFTIEDDFALGEGGQKTKFRNNLAAIKLAKELLEAENSPGGARTATADEQQVLAKYVGWGGLPQAFDPNNAEWSKEHAELKAVLTDEEFAAARQSTRYAHYTSREIIQDGIYAALRRFGFTGGRVLEGGAGVGNFIGLMPQDMRSAGRVTAVEREPIAATIARALYPLQNVQRADFTEFKGNDGYFDAAVGNPPFASDPQTDRSGRKHLSGLSLHNYFFAKEVDMLREGGVLAQVVTNSFLDSAGDRARKYISDRTKFLGAIRLPNNAFSKNAGTEVTTDLIFLQKRPEAEWGGKAARAEAKAWLDVAKQYDRRKGASYNLNQYFVDHPEMMLGDFGAHGTMHGPDQPALIARPGQDTAALLREAVQRLPADIYVDRAVLGTDAAIENATRALSNPPVQEGGFYIEDGKLIQRVPDVAGEARGREITAATQWTAKTSLGDSGFDKIVRLSSMRETLRDLLAAELSGNPMMDGLRLQLNEKYDQYVKEHGLLGDPGTARVFDDDPDFPLLLSLEHNYTPGIGIAAAKRQGLKATKSTAKKAPIFKQRVVDARKTVQKVETPADALAVSMAERGKLDTAYIGKLLDKDPDQVLKELSTGDKPLLFLDPATDEYVLRDAYLSGNVRAKLEQANRAGLSLNARELERVIPDDVGAHEIVAKIGSPWVPTSVYQDFAVDLFGEGTKASIQYVKLNSAYSVYVKAGNQLNAVSKWGTESYTGPELLSALLNNRAIKVTYKDGEGKTHTDVEKTELANTKAQEIRDRFQDWLFADAERSELLVRTYNDTNNNYVTREYDGTWMTFPGKVPDSVIKFRRHQRNAIARIVQDRTALLDHVVGAGKTFTIVAGAMELRRTGLARKPMVAVPNHLVKQWAADFYRLYPGANILTATKKDFEKVNRRRFLAKIATGDWDAVVIAHSSFGFIKPGAEFEAEFNQRQVKMIMDTIRQVRDSDADGPAKKRTVKQLEGMKERLENRVRSLRDKAMDDLLDFEQLGVDQLFVDEAHMFKNLMFTTKMQGVQGLGDAKGSQRAYDMYVKSQEVLEKNGRGQGLVFATGTPVSNSLAEKYHMMRYLMPKQMEDLGFQSFDAWANTFASVEQVWMQKPSGDGYKASNRMSNFVNVHELLKMFDQVADTVTMDDIKKAYKEENDGKEFPIPPLKTGRRQPVSLEKSPAQIAYMEKIAQRAKALEQRRGPPKKGEDNVLVIMGDARKAAMDIRLVDVAINDREPGGRIDAAASRILDRYQQWNHVKGTQLVFSDLGTPKKHAQAELKEYNALMERVTAATDEVRERAAFGAEDAQAIVDDAEDAQAAIDANGPDWMTAVQAALRGFSVYDDLKDALVERGIPENEIAFIHDYNTDERKASLFRKVNAGDIRVLIGSTAKMGAGTNVQERLVAEHHLDVPWRPSDVEQREGRIERQGNLLYEQVPGFEIEILAYVTKDTLDMRMWQIQEVKLKMINQLRTRQIDRNIDNAFEDMEMSAGEMQAAATGNMDLLREIQARADIKKLEQRRRSFDAQKSDLTNRRKSVAQRLQGLPAQLAQAEVLAEAGALYDKALTEQAESFKVTIDGKEYTDRYEASKVLLSKVDAKMYVRTAEKDGKKVREEMTVEEHNALAKKVQDMRASGVTGAALEEAVHELTSWDEKAAPLDVELNGEQFTARAKLQEAWSNASGDRDPIVWEYQGQKYNRRAALALALRGPVVDAIADEKLVELGSIGPFKVTAEGQTASAGFHKGEKMLDIVLAYKGKQIEGQIFVPDGETSVKVGEQIATWADRKASGAANELAYLKNELARAEKAKAELDNADDMGEWPDQGKLEEARKRHQDILKRLGGKTADGVQDPAFAQGDATGGMSAAIVQHTADMLAAEWKNAPNIVALSSIAGAPAKVRDDARARQARGGGKPKAVFYQGTVYLFADALRNQAEAAEYTYHEVLGHYGMRGHFGEDLDRELKNIVQLRGADITRMYERTGKERSAAMDLRMAEEVVAYMAQTQPELNFVKRIIATIKNFLRDHVPGFASLNMSDADIIQKFILPARQFVQGPDGPDGGLELSMAFGAGLSEAEGRAAFDRMVKADRDTVHGALMNWNDAELTEDDEIQMYVGRDSFKTRNYDGLEEGEGAVDVDPREFLRWLFSDAPLNPKQYTQDADWVREVKAMREAAGIGENPSFGQAEPERIALLAKELATIEDRMPAIRAVAPEARVEDGKLVVNKENATRVRRILGTPAVGAGPMFAQGEDREDTGQVPPSGKAASKLLESITIDNVRRHAGYKFTDYRTLGLGILGRRQIAELYAKDLPDLAQYSELVQQMDADKNEEGAAADGVARAWDKLPDEKALANLMHDATLAQIDPANDYMTGDSHIDYEVLRRDWDRLTPEAKTIYVQARDMYEEHYARVREAMRERIERAEISDERKADLLARMDGEFFDRIKGVYFPLARFGKYVVVVKDADGDTASVSRAETMGEAMESRAAMQKAFPEDKGFKISKVLLAAEFNASRDGVGRGFLKSLFNVLDQEGVSDELQDAINQLYLSSLPDLSWAKHGIHRKGTPGFSQDARRAFAQNMFHGARYLAKLRYADQLQTLLDSMEKTVKTNEETQGFDSVKAQQVVDEMTKRHDLLMNPKSNPLSTALTSIGFVFHMGLSPASAMVNLSQTGLVSYPAMGARWGFGKAGKALLEAGREAAVSKNDLSTVLKDDELRAYDAAVKAGTIDVTLAHDLAGIAQGEDSKVVWKMRPVMRAASFLFHHAERFNRQVTFIAAYRLAREAGAGHQPAYKQATQVTYDTHFDYSSGNRPRFMQGNMARVLLLFKQFAQNMIYTITRQAYLSMKGLAPEDRKLARKNLAGLLVMHAAGAGVLGLPLVGTLLAAASFIGGGDDEPWDAEVALRNMLADAIGQKPAEVLAHGLSRLTPFDISGRVGLDKLILPDIQEGLEGVRLAESMMAAALGPVAGIGINVARGAQKIGEGNWARGLEDMMPSALRGPLKALRYAQEGAIDKTGIPIVDNVGPVAVLGQALGLSPSEVREATEGKSAVKRLDSRISERRRILLQQYSKAMALGDSDAVTDARAEIQEFNNKQPDYRIKGESMLKSVVNRRRRIADAEDGIYLPKGHRSTREAGRFAREDE